MTEQKFGHIIARGTPSDVALIEQAIKECVNLPKSLGQCINRDFVIEVHSSQEFLAATPPAVVPGTKLPAQGHVMPGGELWINRSIVNRKPARARHIVRHEVAHVIPLTESKKTDLCRLMEREDGSHPDPTKWKGYGYVGRPSECFADTFAVAASSQGSPWDDYAYWKLDVDEKDYGQIVAIALRVDPLPPDPETPTDPLPPVSPELAAALEALETCKVALVATQAKLVAAKNNAQATLDL